MYNYYEKKDKKQIKTNINCFNCGRQLTESELFFNPEFCVICRLKKSDNLKPINLNEKH